MKHFIKTSFGISDRSYGESRLDGKQVQGSGQGNGASPTIWALISTPLLNMMRTLGFGVSLKAPLSQETTNFVGCSFVDDTDLLQSSTTSSTPLAQSQQDMQDFIDAWCGGLRATGGALVPSKSWIYPIEFHFNAKGQPSYKNPTDMNLHFTVKDAWNTRQELVQIHPSIAKETLGVFLAPDGNENKQIEYLTQKIKKWEDKIRTNQISKIHAYTALTTTIYKTIEYSLPTSTITKENWKKIMAPLNKCGLQINGICSKFPTALREGAKSHIALQFKCMYKQQEILKLEKYLTFRSHQGIVGKMIRLSEELLKIETGLPGNIFIFDYSKYCWLASNSWIKSLWKFLSLHDINLHMLTPDLKETKKNDLFIMKEFVAQGYSKKKLLILNACRKYLQVTTLGEITNGDGNIIIRNIKSGCKLTCSTSTLSWPNQAKPDNSAWMLWRSALRKTFEISGKIAPGMIRNQWAIDPPRVHHWYHDWISNCLLQRLQNNHWRMYRQSIRRGRRATFPVYHFQQTELNSLPTHARRASILPCNPTQVIFTGSGQSQPPTNNPPINSLEDYVNSLAPKDRWPFEYISGQENIDHIVVAIQQGNCALISDGSFDPTTHQAAAAWILGNEALYRQIKGDTLCSGNKMVHSAYRGELAGIFGGLCFIEAICFISNIQHGKLLLGCDGLSALKRIQQPTLSLSSSHFDYTSAIKSILTKLPINIEFIHVEGHADRKTPIERLSVVEKMNIMADHKAKAFNSTSRSNDFLENLSLKGEIGPISLPINQSLTKITSKFRNSMYDALTKQPTVNYWMKKMNISPLSETSIDWNIMGNAFKSISQEKQKEIVKWNSEFCGTSKNLKRWGDQTHQKCPVCGYDGETTDHILRCPHPEANKAWKQTVGALENWMTQQSTDPMLKKAIIENINAWRKHDAPPPCANSNTPLHEVIQKQTEIGWGPFLRGFIHINWKEIQHRYLQSIQSKLSHKRWLKMMIIKLWQISWDMWRFRNGVLHTQDTKHITNFTFLLTTEILKEKEFGCNLLPPKCKYLFNQPRDKLLASTINNKKLWLANVWAARDAYTPADISTQTRNQIVHAQVVAWKKKLK